MCKMFTSKFFKIVADLVAVVQKNKQALRRERNKVEVFEGKFRSLKFFLAPKRKQTFTCHTFNQNCYTCVRVMFWKKSTLTEKRFRSDFVESLYNNPSAQLAISFCL